MPIDDPNYLKDVEIFLTEVPPKLPKDFQLSSMISPETKSILLKKHAMQFRKYIEDNKEVLFKKLTESQKEFALAQLYFTCHPSARTLSKTIFRVDREKWDDLKHTFFHYEGEGGELQLYRFMKEMGKGAHGRVKNVESEMEVVDEKGKQYIVKIEYMDESELESHKEALLDQEMAALKDHGRYVDETIVLYDQEKTKKMKDDKPKFVVAKRIVLQEKVLGMTLHDLLREYPGMTENIKKSIFVKCVEAIQETHKKGWIHRDITEDNIMIDFDPVLNEVKSVSIIDFGCSVKVASGEQEAYFRRGTPFSQNNYQCVLGGFTEDASGKTQYMYHADRKKTIDGVECFLWKYSDDLHAMGIVAKGTLGLTLEYDEAFSGIHLRQDEKNIMKQAQGYRQANFLQLQKTLAAQPPLPAPEKDGDPVHVTSSPPVILNSAPSGEDDGYEEDQAQSIKDDLGSDDGYEEEGPTPQKKIGQ